MTIKELSKERQNAIIQKANDAHKKMQNILQELSEIPSVTENVAIAKNLAISSAAVTLEVVNWLAQGVIKPIIDYGYTKEKLDRAQNAYDGLIHNDKIKIEVT